MFIRKIISFCLAVLFSMSVITGVASANSTQTQHVKQMQAAAGVKMVNPVAATPISIPRPIRLQKITPLAQVNQSQHMTAPVPSGSIVNCFLKSQSGNTLILTLEYQVDPEIKTPVYVGGWLYEGRQKTVDSGYTPTQVAALPKGTIDLPLILNTTPFTSIYAEVFLIQNGTIFGKSQFTFPFTWDGASGKFMVSGNPLPADQQTNEPGQSSMQADAEKLFCQQYADAAIAQFNMGRQYRLEGIVPPVWSNDKKGHFNWCMKTDQHVVRGGDMMRAQHILNGLPQAVLNDMKTRGQQVPGLDPGRGP